MIARAALAVLWLGLACPAVAQVFEDDGTQWQGIHVCDRFAAMTGAHVAGNWFLCQQPSRGAPFIDSRTTAMIRYRGSLHPVHVCPPGLAMSGLHASGNLLVCSPAPLSGLPTVDLGTQAPIPNHGGTMHACPPGQVMVGIQVGDNVLICQPSS